MKQKKFNKKLSFTKKTIANLDSGDMLAAHGGKIKPTGTICNTDGQWTDCIYCETGLLGCETWPPDCIIM